MGQRRRMFRFSLKKWWPKKKSRREKHTAGSELQILSRETREQPKRQPQGQPLKWKVSCRRLFSRFHRSEDPERTHPLITSKDFLQLVEEGQFLEACMSILSSAQDGQDCSPQFQLVAQSMWQVVQRALGDVRPSKELKLQLQSVAEAVEWARDTLQNVEDGALCDHGVAAWGCQLERLLRSDAEACVPTWDPRNQLGPYLEELDEAVGQALGPGGAGRLGPHLERVYKMCFQEALLSRLCQVLSSCGHHRESCYRLYTWGHTALFGLRGEALLDAPVPSQKPEAESLLNQMVFVTWMSQVQKTLVELIQEELTKRLDKVLICEWKYLGTSPYRMFFDLPQLLKETIHSVQHIGQPVTGQVQALVLEMFLKFLERYHAEATRFLQNMGAGTFLEMHMLENCHILRKTWQELSQEYVAPVSLDQAVQDTIDVIEGHSRGHLLSSVRVLCQSLLRDHFGKKNKNLARALQSLRQGLEDFSRRSPAPLCESLVESLYMAVFGEYIQALVSHLWMREPRKWGDLQDQVDTDTWSLLGVFGEHGGPGLAKLQESIMEFFLPGKDRGSQALDSWLASLRDRFPGFLREDFEELEVEVKGKRTACCCLC